MIFVSPCISFEFIIVLYHFAMSGTTAHNADTKCVQPSVRLSNTLEWCAKCHTKTSIGWEKDTTGEPIYWHGFRVDCPTCKTETWVWMKCGDEDEEWRNGNYFGPYAGLY
jgi:hypothetical protein